jgi:Tfp pilus assembly protein PilF
MNDSPANPTRKQGIIRPSAWICLLLAAATISVYWQSGRFEFIGFDDSLYVSDNRYVTAGLTRESIAWSFSFDEKDKTYWHPLSWLSHMLDVELFGLDPGPHHLSNVALHLANVLLLFFLLTRLTGSPWRCGLVAGLFAVHPINVESVAWVAERKNVLSTCFWLLTVHAYVTYAQKPGGLRYGILTGVFTLGLMAKPMMVTLPGVLLLLDYWPLGRLRLGSGGHVPGGAGRDGSTPAVPRRRVELVMEKIPLLVLALLASYLTMDSLRHAGSVISFEAVPLALRLQNALGAYLAYIGTIFFPSRLAVFYPYPAAIPLWQTGIAALLLIGMTVWAGFEMKKRPYLIVGWLWFLGTLVPVSGLLQVGLWPAMADRWAYIPAIGLFLVATWIGHEQLQRWRGQGARYAAAALAIVIVAGLALVAQRQTAVWGNSVALFESALANTDNNYVAHNNLGAELYRQERTQEALFHFHESARIYPEYYLVHYNIGIDFFRQQRFEEAETWFSKALTLRPRFGGGQKNMAGLKLKLGKIREALEHYAIAVELEPGDKTIHNDIGCALMQTGQPARAVRFFQNALRLDPEYADAHNNIGVAYSALGQTENATRHLQQALSIRPEYAEARQNLKDALASKTD